MTAPTRFRMLGAGAVLLVMAAVGSVFFSGVPRAEAQAAAPPAIAAGPAANAATQPGGGIVASVDGDPITEQDLDVAYTEFADQLANYSLDQRRDVTINLLIHIRVLAKEAAKEGIDQEPAMMETLRLARDRALYNEYLNRLFDKEVTEDAAHALFDKEQAAAGPQFQYHVAHILVPTEAEAKTIITKLDAGGDFAALAKAESIDTGSADMGGDLGFIATGDTVMEFETAAFGLTVGKYTETPVESQFGFHVIKLIEKKAADPKTFEDSIPDLQDELAQNAFQKVLDDLQSKSVIYKAPAPGQAPAAPAAPAAN